MEFRRQEAEHDHDAGATDSKSVCAPAFIVDVALISFSDVNAPAAAASASMTAPAAPSTPSKATEICENPVLAPVPPSTGNHPVSSSKTKGGFGFFEGAINRLSAFEKQAMSKEREQKLAAASSNSASTASAAQHAAIPIIEMDSDHSDAAGEAGSHGSRTPSAGHTDGEERCAARDARLACFPLLIRVQRVAQ